VATYRRLSRLWRPPAETIEAMAAVLGAHWRAAATRTVRTFWATPASWLRIRRAVTVAAVSVTTSPPEADSLDTPPGPHPY
jgi:hypothetical protein